MGTLTVLHSAVKNGAESIIKLLFKNGVNVNATSEPHKFTALHMAVEQDKNGIIQLLLSQNDVNVNACDEYGHTPLKLAAEKGNQQTVKWLIEKGADITKADSVDNTAIHVAADKGHYGVLQLLLLSGAFAKNPGIIGKQNKDKNTPLHLAVARECQNSVALLLCYGAVSSLELENRHNKTPKQLAKGNKVIMELLENPLKAKQHLMELTRPVVKVIGRGGSVGAESDHYPVTEQITSQPTSTSLATVLSQATPGFQPAIMYVTAAQVPFKSESHTEVRDRGYAAIGTQSGLHVGQSAVTPTGVQSQLSSTGESSYSIEVTAGRQVIIGDSSVINVETTTPRTSQAGTTETEGLENRDSRSPQTLANSAPMGTDLGNRTEKENTPGECQSSDVGSVGSPVDKAQVPSTPGTSSCEGASGQSVVNPALLQKRTNAAKRSGVLDFSHIGLSSFPENLYGVNRRLLTKLDLSHNMLRELPELIGDLINLKHLSANDNQLTLLPRTIKQLQQLQELDLRNNKLKSVVQDTNDLIRLERLSVEGNPLRIEEVRSLIELMERRPSLWIDIAECFRRLKPLDTAHWKNRLEYVVTTAIDFEAKHKECVRVLPYDDPAKVHFYVFSGKSGVPQKLKDAAQECFGEMKVKLEWFDLYNDATEILKVTPIELSSGKPERLNESQIYKINEIINKNLHVLVKHRNVTAVQASFKIINSKQTKQPCIAIYVLGKGSIPVGEIEFPRTLGGYDVDVVDGFWFTTGEDDPWRPNEGQEQCEVLCLGASIGVEGEEGCGTLGAIVEGDGKFYALSCDHVMKRAQKSKIIHPARDDYLNYLNYHLQQYVERIQYIIKREQRFLRETISQFSFDSIKDLERLKLKFQELKSLKEEHYDQDRAKKGNLEKVELHEKALENGFKTPPRVIGRYIAGISRNMRWTDGQEYFIDAAVAELTPKEIKGLRESEKIEMIGTGKSPSGRCSSSFTAFGELCKSGRTTEYTNSGRHANPNVYLRLSSYRLNAQNKHLNDVVKRVSICHTCAYSAGVEEDLEPTFSPCGFCRVDTETLNDEVWLKNCLCIDRPYDPAKGDAFSAGGDSGAVIFEIEEKKSLLGFGIIFAQQCHSYGSCALASPLLPTLQTLSREIPVTESLSLSSNVVGIPSDSDTGESPWWCNIV